MVTRTLKKALVAIAAALFLAVAGYLMLRPAAMDAAAYYGRAGEAFDAGNLRAARVDLLNVIKQKPGWAAAHLAHAEVLLGLNDGAGAEIAARRAVASGIAAETALPFIAHALWLQGKPRDASDLIETGPVRETDRAWVERIRGRARIDLSDLDGARAAFDTALKIAPDNARLWTDIAFFRWRAGNIVEARQAADHAVQLDNRDVRALQFRGELERSVAGLVPALGWFERGLAIAPDDVPLLVEYGATLGDVGRYRDMLTVSRRVIAMEPRNGRAFFMQAVIAARAAEPVLARALIERSGDAGRLPAGLLLHGLVEYGDGNFNQAFDKFHALLALQPGNLQARRLAALALHRSGDHFAAQAMIAPLVSPAASSHDLMLAARIYEALGEQRIALPLLERAAEKREPALHLVKPVDAADALAAQADAYPDDASVVIPYVRALVAAGNTDAARTHAERLSVGNPGVVEAQLVLADVLFISGQPARALAAAERARGIAFTEPVLLRLVAGHEAMGNGDASWTTAHDFLAANPASIAARRVLYRLALASDDWPAVVAHGAALRRRIGNRDWQLMAGLARGYDGVGARSKALAAARSAYLAQPASPLTTHIYGYALLQQGGQPEATLNLLRKAVSLAPENNFLRYHLARAYVAAGQKKEAKAVLALALAGYDFPERRRAEALLKKL